MHANARLTPTGLWVDPAPWSLLPLLDQASVGWMTTIGCRSSNAAAQSRLVRRAHPLSQYVSRL
jgi:hypothetical protein